MSEAKHHDNWKLMAKRRTIETRFSVLCTEFDIQSPLVRSLCGLELWLESIIGFIIEIFQLAPRVIKYFMIIPYKIICQKSELECSSPLFVCLNLAPKK